MARDMAWGLGVLLEPIQDKVGRSARIPTHEDATKAAGLARAVFEPHLRRLEQAWQLN